MNAEPSSVASEALCASLGIPSDYGMRRGLKLHFEVEKTTEALFTWKNRSIALEPETAEAWTNIVSAAAKSGIGLLAVSGFRSYERQAELIREKLKAGRTLDEILRTTAAPGYSEHHSGRAVDITSGDCAPLTEAFEATFAFTWLCKHACDFGFTLSFPRENKTGFIFEPWHWFRN